MIFAIVRAANRIGDRSQPARLRPRDDRGQDGRRAYALVVVADQNDVALRELLGDHPGRAAGDRLVQGPAILIIDANHLLRMPVLSPADVSFLDRAGPARIGDDARVVDVQIGENPANACAVGVVADNAGQGHPGAEGAQHGGHAAGPAEPFLAPIGPEENDGRFLADAFGVAPDVAIEHEIADDQHAWLAEALHQIDQFRGHRESPADGRLRLSAARALSRKRRGGYAACAAPSAPPVRKLASPRPRVQ